MIRVQADRRREHQERINAELQSATDASTPPAGLLHIEGPIEPFIELLMTEAGPNWERIGRTICCSRCGYELRMLSEPRCPECGFLFDWRQLLTAVYTEQAGTYYEQNWTRHPFRAVFRTFFRSLRPAKFWSSVSIHERIQPKPLYALTLAACIGFFVTLHGLAWIIAAVARAATMLMVPRTGLTPSYRAAIAMRVQMVTSDIAAPRGLDNYWMIVPGLILMLILGTHFMLGIFRQTLRRCRVRPEHLLRVLAYSSLAGLAGYAAIAVTVIAVLFGLGARADLAALCGLVGVFYWIWHIRTGLRVYLGLPRSFLLAATSVGVAHLAALTLLTVVQAGVLNRY